jgi:hypothetical protein
MTEYSTQTQRYIEAQIAARPIEVGIIRRIWDALEDAGSPVVTVWDGEERTGVHDLEGVFELVFNLDVVWLETKAGYIFLAMGEEWDIICDYSTSLEDALAPVNAYIGKNW